MDKRLASPRRAHDAAEAYSNKANSPGSKNAPLRSSTNEQCVQNVRSATARVFSRDATVMELDDRRRFWLVLVWYNALFDKFMLCFVLFL